MPYPMIKKESKMQILYVDRKKFLNWYFSCDEDFRRVGEEAYDYLCDGREYSITLEDLFESRADTPTGLIKNWDIVGCKHDDDYIGDLYHEGLLPKDFWKRYDIELEEKKWSYH